jgi:hypothetical protein
VWIVYQMYSLRTVDQQVPFSQRYACYTELFQRFSPLIIHCGKYHTHESDVAHVVLELRSDSGLSFSQKQCAPSGPPVSWFFMQDS